MNIYFSEGDEVNNKDNTSQDFKFFKATYVNPYKDEHKEHLTGEVIQEEDEDEMEYDDDFKEALRIK